MLRFVDGGRFAPKTETAQADEDRCKKEAKRWLDESAGERSLLNGFHRAKLPGKDVPGKAGVSCYNPPIVPKFDLASWSMMI